MPHIDFVPCVWVAWTFFEASRYAGRKIESLAVEKHVLVGLSTDRDVYLQWTTEDAGHRGNMLVGFSVIVLLPVCFCMFGISFDVILGVALV